MALKASQSKSNIHILLSDGYSSDEKENNANEVIEKSVPNDFFTSWDKIFDSFEFMGLSEEIVHGVYMYGIEHPSEVQKRAIVPFALGYDLVGQAQSGTGKTLAFCLGILGRIKVNTRVCQAVVIVPTRELALQVAEVVKAVAVYTEIFCIACTGGRSVEHDKAEFKKGVHVIVGTPGRLGDLVERRLLVLEQTRMLVLDEVDEMLGRGFIDDIVRVKDGLPKDVQVGLFSATLSSEVLDFTLQYLKKPVRVLVRRTDLTLEGIRQFWVYVEREENKLSTIIDLYEKMAISQSVIFVNSRKKVEELYAKLTDIDFTVSCIHSDMDQGCRDAVMKGFRSGATRVLIATDLIARGIDVQQVSHVMNYDVPFKPETYLHRVGRAGRFGRKGIVITFVNRGQFGVLRAVESMYGSVIEPLPGDVEGL